MVAPAHPLSPRATARGVVASVWSALSGVIGTVTGLVPHVLHHVGIFAGAAVVTGLGGNLLFAAVGLLLSVPLLRRLHRRFGTWRAPAIALGVFTAAFALSALVIGPAISGSTPADPPSPPSDPSSPVESPSPDDHVGHHAR